MFKVGDEVTLIDSAQGATVNGPLFGAVYVVAETFVAWDGAPAVSLAGAGVFPRGLHGEGYYATSFRKVQKRSSGMEMLRRLTKPNSKPSGDGAKWDKKQKEKSDARG